MAIEPTNVSILSIEDILSKDDLEERVVEVPEWGGSVRIKAFTKARQQEMRKRATIKGEIDTDRLEMFLFIEGVVEPRFTADHYEQLRGKNAGAVDKVLQEIARLSGVSAGNADTGERSSMEEAERTFRSEQG